jgi:RNA polymerase sigma factor (sigma-70 family)
VSEPDRDELRALWLQQARRNDWALVEDAAAFLDQAAAEFSILINAKTPGERLRLAVSRTYSALLYRGLRSRQERAAQELWLTFVRTALRDRWPRAEAEELAQEAIARILERLPAIESPQGFLTFAFKLFFRLLRDSRGRQQREQQREQSFQANQEEPAHEPADPADLASEVGQDMIIQELWTLLQARLSNELERRTLWRIIVFGDDPRDVARDLGLPLHRTRLAKSRALARLRQDEAFMRMVRDLAGDQGSDPSETGAQVHDT